MFVSVLRQSIIFVHRWLGVGLSFVFLMWFLSGNRSRSRASNR